MDRFDRSIDWIDWIDIDRSSPLQTHASSILFSLSQVNQVHRASEPSVAGGALFDHPEAIAKAMEVLRIFIRLNSSPEK